MSNDNGNDKDKSKHVISLKGRQQAKPGHDHDDIGSDVNEGFVRSLRILLAVNGGFVLEVDYTDTCGSDHYIVQSKEELLGILTDILSATDE